MVIHGSVSMWKLLQKWWPSVLPLKHLKTETLQNISRYLFTRLNYDFSDRYYLIEFSLRRDGTSRFSPDSDLDCSRRCPGSKSDNNDNNYFNNIQTQNRVGVTGQQDIWRLLRLPCQIPGGQSQCTVPVWQWIYHNLKTQWLRRQHQNGKRLLRTTWR